MCGISILIVKQAVDLQAPLRQMNEKIIHRGPDDGGFFFGKDFAFGHRRLSILDLSEAGHQPMQYRNNWITYNGEVYNYLELKEELRSYGYAFHTATDTEVILAAYDCWGVGSFARFNGMWAFSLYDASQNKLIFCRDHFGIKPLYYYDSPILFAAASEIKQFTDLPGFTPYLNKGIAAQFLMNGLLNYTNQTFFDNVLELRPGHYLSYDLNTRSFTVTRWYDLNASCVPIKDNFEVATQTVRTLLHDSIRLRMRSDVAVGSCLSGGIDSSAIVVSVHKNGLANKDFATVTSCYENKRFDEQQFSDLVSQATGFTSHKVYPNLDNLFDKGHFDKMIYHQDQPFSGASHYSEFNVFKTASENGITVMLDGQGSDEYLCGYGEFYITYLRSLLRNGRISAMARLMNEKAVHRQVTFSKEAKSVFMSSFGYPAIKWYKRKFRGIEVPWLAKGWQHLAEGSICPNTDHDIRSLSLQEIIATSIPFQLHSEDRNSMMFSIESRLPFLDHRLVEYVMGLPDEYKISGGYTKHVLRKAIAELPDPIKFRKDKMGFVAPDGPWMLANHELVRKELESVTTDYDIFTPVLLERFDRFLRGKMDYEPIYFRALAFARFCKIFNMNISAS
ncbi:MAG TPA: asparagine synthase (glutamine-hydrolyzing) [Flavipsychrobacter sp.]|mgnify:CR=1 FL=1|nr:asparagine synthase (glutamine-hydrolyzing) [Flavipsychrobacter sp.]